MQHVEELQASAETDFLLDIPNRRGFERELNRAIAYIKRYHASGALIVLDVDRLKPINDSFGHAAGDQVLKAVAKVLTGQVRSSDVVGRLGGDEFALLLWNLTETDARAKAATLEAAIDRLTFIFSGRNVTAGASAGVAVLGPNAQASRALEEADRAMYVRKAQRRREAHGEAVGQSPLRSSGTLP
jgi:diguanylate cyclase (GGDEF)-like protein